MRPVFALLLIFSPAFSQPDSPGPGFVRFAGSNKVGDGDNGPAIHAYISPTGLAFDARGNLFIAEPTQNRVRKLGPDGIITTVAGNGQRGFSGDGGPAIYAQLDPPLNLAVDSTGNLFLSCGVNIRRVSPDGIITTVAGNGESGSAGDGGPAIAAQLSASLLAVDSQNNLYVGDFNGFRVRKIDTHGLITTAAGGQYGYSGDGGLATSAAIAAFALATDASGNFYILGGGHIRKISPDGIIHTVATGTTTGKEFLEGAMAIRADGTIYVADSVNHRVLKVTPDGAFQTIAGTGDPKFSEGCGSAAAPLARIAANAGMNPMAIMLDAQGLVYIADKDRVRKITPDGLIATIAGPGPSFFGGDGGPALSAQFNSPGGMAADAAGNIFVADTLNNRIRKITSDGVVRTVAGDGTPTSSDDPACFVADDGWLNHPSGVAVDLSGNLYVADTGNNRIRKLAPDGTAITIPIGQFAPRGVAVDQDGNIFVDVNDGTIRKMTSDGNVTTLAFATGGGVAVDAQGNLYHSSGFSGWLYQRTPMGEDLPVLGTGDARNPADPYFVGPITINSAGSIVAADSKGHLQRRSPGCAIDVLGITRAGGAAYDPAGNLYLSVPSDNVIWQLPHNAAPPPKGPTPMLGSIAVYNAASFDVALLVPATPFVYGRRPIAPGEMLSIRGICLGPDEPVSAQADENGVLAPDLGGTHVTFDALSAPILSAQSGQLELIAPYELAGQSTSFMRVTFQGHSTSLQLDVADTAMGIFTLNGAGIGQAAAVNFDGSINSRDNPAPRGSVVSLFATGLGQTDPPQTDGKLASGLSRSLIPVFVTIGGQNAQVLFAGAAPGFVGISQINFVVPGTLTPGPSVPIHIDSQSRAILSAVTLAIR